MWASSAKLRSSSSSAIRSLDWVESADGSGGWLATGGEEGTVGISWIDDRGMVKGAGDESDNLACTANGSLFKSHFNLRGHVGQIHLVRWMNGGDKLATYDSWGRLISWRSRANVLAREFQIHTSIMVTDMQWSHCGHYLFACGEDGHIQLFSSFNGLNIFSLQIQGISPLTANAKFTTTSWNEPSTRIALGTETGEAVLLDPNQNGQIISTMTVKPGVPVQSIQWYGPVVDCTHRSRLSYKSQSLCVLLKNGDVVIFKSTSSRHCVCCKTAVFNGHAKWNSSYTLLSIVGYQDDLCTPIVRLVNAKGYVVSTITEGLPQLPREKVSTQSFCWAMQDSALFLALGSDLYTIEVLHAFPSLRFLCQRAIAETIGEGSETGLEQNCLPLPRKEVENMDEILTPWITTPITTRGPGAIEALFKPVPPNQRLLCVIDETTSSSFSGYTMKYEFLNHYIPFLRAKRKSRKPGNLLHAGYAIETVPGAFREAQDEGKYCAREFEGGLVEGHCQKSVPTRQPSKSVVRWVKSTFKHGHRRDVMDASRHPQRSPESRVSRATKQPSSILAEVEANSITNSYQFSTSSPLVRDGHLGSLSISTAYIKRRPRSVQISLPFRQELGSDSGVEEDEVIALQSRLPDWNEQYQFFELDFGGRVCRDSIRNFQIESDGNIVSSLEYGGNRIGDHGFLVTFCRFSSLEESMEPPYA